MNTKPALERFQAKVEMTDECWLWKGAKKPSGYGNFYMGGRYLGAHCAAYELFVGPITKGFYVCHSCDTPGCVNPSHLFLGTPKQNTLDMLNKGRAVGVAEGGELHPIAKLTEARVQEIRERRGAGAKLRELAADMGVCEATISYVCSNKTWKSA